MKIFNNFKKTALIAPILMIAISSCNSEKSRILHYSTLFFFQKIRIVVSVTLAKQRAETEGD